MRPWHPFADEANYTAVLVGEPGPLRPVIDVADFTVAHLTAARSLVFIGTRAFASEVAVDLANAAAP